MQRYWKPIQVALVVALAAFVVSMMLGMYTVTYGILVTAGVFAVVLLVGMARFRNRRDTKIPNRPDPEEQPPADSTSP
jgi:membrane protein implicated in regulation of membrane protease activity